MPRGMHPNSRKALEEHRAATQFKHGDSKVEMKQKELATKAMKRTFREEFEIELAAIMKDRSGNETTVKNAITKAAIARALKGDMRAQEFIRDTIGEKPAEKVELSTADPEIIKEIEAMVYDTK